MKNKVLSILSIVLIVLITIFLGYQLTNITVKEDMLSYLSENDPEVIKYNEVTKKFGKKDFLIVGVELDNIYSKLYDIELITKELQKLKEVKSVNSLTNVIRIKSEKNGIEVGSLTEMYDLSDKTLDLEDEILSDDILKENFISKDGKAVLFTLEINTKDKDYDFYSLKKNIEKIFLNYNYDDIYYSGLIFMNEEMAKMSVEDILRIFPFALILIISVLYFMFRSFTGIFIPIITVLISVVWVMGTMVLSFNTLTSITLMVPTILIGIGVDYSIHFFNRYNEDISKGFNVESSIKETYKSILKPIFLTTITTIIGVLSLVTAGIKPISQLAIMASVGITYAFMISLIFGPALIFLIRPQKKKILNEKGHNEFLKKYTKLVLKNKKLIILSIIILIAIFTIQIPKLEAKMDLELYLPKNSDSIKGSDYIENNFGGNNYITLYLKGDKENMYQDFYYNRVMRNIKEYIQKFEKVDSSRGFSDLVSNWMKSYDGIEYIPADNSAMSQIFLFLKGSDSLRQIAILDSSESIMEFKMGTSDVDLVYNLSQKAQNFMKDNIIYSYDVIPFNKEDYRSIEGFENELKFFVLSRHGNYEKIILNTLLDAKDKDVLEILKSLNQEDMLNRFNEFLESYDENKVNMNTFISMIEKNDDYIQNYLYQSEKELKAKYVYEKLLQNKEKINIEEKDLKELSFYVNDILVPISGDTNKLDINLTGNSIVTANLNKIMIDSQLLSLFIALILVTIAFMIIMKSFIFGLIAMIPLGITLIMNFGFIKFVGFYLNAATITIASIVIGLGIDYIIHYLSRFSEEYIKTHDKYKSIINASSTTGNAIFSAALTTIFGFLPLSFAKVGFMAQFGAITAFNIFIAFIMTLTIFPIILNILPDKFYEKNFLKNKGAE
ncbi:MMPL family transporter [Oceanotoga sp. DSM 15011]|uniref:efflux RND transporter permease subunit n=1 Tax=Oceanotoga sp. DSM 15011 TaxID=2984951 RepID=UPI0021F45B0E|nr:MMPL family transporter [Oceanotoga sp. DSM 15011]UYP01393.1 MMPL family transporter [Oceanotoga sp. DSM 15011]